jgi:hypothetical protein
MCPCYCGSFHLSEASLGCLAPNLWRDLECWCCRVVVYWGVIGVRLSRTRGTLLHKHTRALGTAPLSHVMSFLIPYEPQAAMLSLPRRYLLLPCSISKPHRTGLFYITQPLRTLRRRQSPISPSRDALSTACYTAASSHRSPIVRYATSPRNADAFISLYPRQPPLLRLLLAQPIGDSISLRCFLRVILGRLLHRCASSSWFPCIS